MFDVCDLIVRTLSPRSRLRPKWSGYGAADHELVLDGVPVARKHVLGADDEVALGPRIVDVGGWTCLSLARSIDVAARSDATWAAYLEVLRELVALHPEWIFRAEVDCDQHPSRREQMTGEDLLARLDRHRRERDTRFALVAWPAA